MFKPRRAPIEAIGLVETPTMRANKNLRKYLSG